MPPNGPPTIASCQRAQSDYSLTGCCVVTRRDVWGARGQWMMRYNPGTCWPWTLVNGGAASMDGGSRAGKRGRKWETACAPCKTGVAQCDVA